MNKTLLLSLVSLFPLTSTAATPVLASLSMLEKIGAPVVAKDASIDVGYSLLTEKMKNKLSKAMHEAGKCGGYEVLPETGIATANNVLASLSAIVKRDRAYALRSEAPRAMEKKPEIVAALAELKEENIRATVEWLSNFPSRYNKASSPNVHVDQLEAKLRELMKSYSGAFTIEQVTHTSTRQKSLKLHLEGKARPSEIVVLGGHLDSISGGGWGGGGGRAPGADDNASGSACLLEALRVLITKGAPERSVEFFWYAGEESGLLGSAEIARAYKAANKNVVAALQLDMTMFPGSGQMVIGNVDDFTSPWLREYLVAMNDTYLGVRLISDRCGYACSDHASWYRQGYPTLMPFESDTEHMNSNIHTANDTISSQTSFAHALVFSKIALVLGMDMANSTAHQ